MCKLIRWVLFTLAVLSCQPPLFDSQPRSGNPYHSDTGRSAAGKPEEPEPSGPQVSLYATAVCFPDTVDWRAGGDSEAMLFLLKDGDEVVRVPMSGRPESYRHRIIRGELWTDHYEKGQMVISCNGEEHFRFPGEEVFNGFWVIDGQLYTLGQRPGGGGLCFRVNGQERFSSESGVLLNGPDEVEWDGGAFCIDSSGIYYTYRVPVRKQEEVNWEYRIMKEDQVEKVVPASADCQVYDIRVWNGTIYRFERRGKEPCLVKGETYITLPFPPGEVPHYCKLVPGGDRILMKGYSYTPAFTYWLRDQSGTVVSIGSTYVLRDLVMDGDRYGYVSEYEDGRVLGVFSGTEVVLLANGRFTLTSSRCVQFRKQTFGVALTAAEGKRHLLIRDRDTTALRFNGYFTSIQID
jgi:hypothetical protein